MPDLEERISRLCRLLSQAGEPELLNAAKFLRQRICHPDSYVVLLGESCSGKSTIINSLLDEPVLPVSGVPSTGAVTEVLIDPEAEAVTYALIYKNATQSRVDLNVFQAQSLHPDPDVRRLRLTVPHAAASLPDVRVFDTPGYGSLVAEHEDVLLDFLPDCDAIIYTVSYRQGVQKSDHTFFRAMMELIRPDIPIHLIVNRCPPSATPQDRRVKEIAEHVEAFLGRPNLTVTLLPGVVAEDGEMVCQFPQAAAFWDCIHNDLFSGDRLAAVEAALQMQLADLIGQARQVLGSRLDKSKMNVQQAQAMRDGLEEYADSLDAAANTIIRPGFADIRRKLSTLIPQCSKQVENNICAMIDRQQTASKDESIAYVQVHMLPYESRSQSEILQQFLRIELDALDKQLNDYLNKATLKFEKDILLRFSAAEQVGEKAAKDFVSRAVNNGAIHYFTQLGGAGGAGAGAANAASHLLKQAGDLVGHTFSRETHNALKHFMSKIGMTSTKYLGAALAGLVELASVAVDYGTWKEKLKQKVRQGVDKWETDLSASVKDDLKELEEKNITTFRDIAAHYRIEAAAYTDPRQREDMQQLEAWLAALDTI